MPPPSSLPIAGRATLTTTASSVTTKKLSTAAARVKPELESRCSPEVLADRELVATGDDKKFSCDRGAQCAARLMRGICERVRRPVAPTHQSKRRPRRRGRSQLSGLWQNPPAP